MRHSNQYDNFVVTVSFKNEMPTQEETSQLKNEIKHILLSIFSQSKEG